MQITEDQLYAIIGKLVVQNHAKDLLLAKMTKQASEEDAHEEQ